MIKLLGERINNEDSVYYSAAKVMISFLHLHQIDLKNLLIVFEQHQIYLVFLEFLHFLMKTW